MAVNSLKEQSVCFSSVQAVRRKTWNTITIKTMARSSFIRLPSVWRLIFCVNSVFEYSSNSSPAFVFLRGIGSFGIWIFHWILELVIRLYLKAESDKSYRNFQKFAKRFPAVLNVPNEKFVFRYDGFHVNYMAQVALLHDTRIRTESFWQRLLLETAVDAKHDPHRVNS